MNEKGKEKYNKFKKKDVIKIGVIGNSNKGKSFLLSKISKIKLPSGTKIKTEGLSIKYPESGENSKIVLLDSFGLDNPILKEQANDEKYKNEKEYFKEKLREKLITELFLQNYIINNSDILILVVSILTYSEQKLINKIIMEMRKNKINKDLIILHNLITYMKINQVEDYLNKYLLKNATFDLEEGHKVSTTEKEIKGKYFYDKNDEQLKIFHLIFANEGSEAGNYYNDFTIHFIENTYQKITSPKPFDIIKTIKEGFIELSKDIIEKPEKNIELKDFDNDDNKIKLNINNEITLKKSLIDELRFSFMKSNVFEPTYNYYKKDDSIIIRVECPGNCSIKPNIDYLGEYTIIKLNGIKKKDIEPKNYGDNIFTNREFGTYNLEIPIKTEDYLIKNEKPKIEEKKGLLILEFKLDKIKEDEVYEPTDII